LVLRDNIHTYSTFLRDRNQIAPEINQDSIREIILGSYRIVYLLNTNDANILTLFHTSRLLKASDLEEVIDG
jgi:toxin ParE1/3/4